MFWNDSGAQPRMVTRQVVATYTRSSFAYDVFGARVYPYHVPSFSDTTASEKNLGKFSESRGEALDYRNEDSPAQLDARTGSERAV